MNSKTLTIYLTAAFVFFALGVAVGEAKAGELSAKLIQHSRLADNDMYQTGSWQGIQISYGSDDGYGFISHETADIIPVYNIGQLTLVGLGWGMKHELTPNLKLFGQLGYYMASHENQGRNDMWANGDTASEGMYYYMNKRYAGIHYGGLVNFNEYQIEYQDTFGISLGFEYTKAITKNLDVGFSVEYRAMKLRELLRVMAPQWKYDETGACWQQEFNRNYSSIGAGLTLNYQF